MTNEDVATRSVERDLGWTCHGVRVGGPLAWGDSGSTWPARNSPTGPRIFGGSVPADIVQRTWKKVRAKVGMPDGFRF